MEKQEKCLMDKMMKKCNCKNCRDYTEGKRRFIKWKIIVVVLAAIIFYISSTSGMYAGESMIFETNLTNPVYIVTGNSSNITGLNVSFENKKITISIPINYKPDNFTIIFFDNTTREVEKIINNGGSNSGSSRGYINRDVITYVPEYINNTIEVEVEKIVDHIEYQETGFKLWHIILAVVLGIIFCYILLWVLIYFTGESE